MSNYSHGGCAMCRKSRVKCDEKRPGCTRCVNRGMVCPGYQRPLRWSLKYETVATIPSPAVFRSCPDPSRPTNSQSSLSFHKLPDVVINSQGELSVLKKPASTESDHLCHESGARANLYENSSAPAVFQLSDLVAVTTHHLSPSAFQDSALFVESYSVVLARVLSIYDGLFSPFRAGALSQWRRSSLLFSTFKFFAGMYQLGFETDSKIREAVDEARIGVLGGLSAGLSFGTSSTIARKTEVLLVINMFGLSSSWYDLGDLGLEHYAAAITLLDEGEGLTPSTHQFFEEFLVYWWMMLAYGSYTSSVPEPPTLSCAFSHGPRMPHPLTGASPESQMLLGMVGRLVLGQRRMVLEHAMTATEAHVYSLSNIGRAQDLKSQLLDLKLPSADMVLDPGDPHTSVQDLLNIAEGYRICALILLYRCYPDLIDNELSAGTDTQEQRQAYLTSLAFKVLQLLESNSTSSGTRTIEAILLIIVSGELPQFGSSCLPDPGTTVGETVSQQSRSNAMIAHARSIVLARFARIQAILPFRTIHRMQSLVLEAWGLMARGSHVFWVDLLIKNNWHFLMI